jgi:short-subunit dehydrogenase
MAAAMAERLAGTDRLTLMGRNATKLAELTRRLQATGLSVDVTDALELDAAMADLEPVDRLIYAVGVGARGKLAGLEAHRVRDVVDANLTGFLLTMRYADQVLTEQAQVIVFGAQPRLVQHPQFAAYAAAKAGLDVTVSILKKEMRRRQFMTVAPGPVDTPFWENVGPVPKGALTPAQVADQVMQALQEDTLPERLEPSA